MIYGYARVSTYKQAKDGNSLDVQEQLLRENGAVEIYLDTYTGTKSSRPEFDKLMQKIQSNDTLIITKLDRIARSVTQGINIIEELINKGVIVHVLNMGVVADTPNGRLIRHLMLAFAEFERDMIVERTREGKAIARQKNGYKEGRPRKYSKDQQSLAMRLLNTYSYSQVEKMTGISKATLYRMRKKYAPALSNEDDMIPGQTNIYDYIDN